MGRLDFSDRELLGLLVPLEPPPLPLLLPLADAAVPPLPETPDAPPLDGFAEEELEEEEVEFELDDDVVAEADAEEEDPLLRPVPLLFNLQSGEEEKRVRDRDTDGPGVWTAGEGE